MSYGFPAPSLLNLLPRTLPSPELPLDVRTETLATDEEELLAVLCSDDETLPGSWSLINRNDGECGVGQWRKVRHGLHPTLTLSDKAYPSWTVKLFTIFYLDHECESPQPTGVSTCWQQLLGNMRLFSGTSVIMTICILYCINRLATKLFKHFCVSYLFIFWMRTNL